MNATNLKATATFIYFVSVIAVIYQLIITNSLNDFACIVIIFLSNIFTTYYCFNKKYFFKFPITFLMIFFSHFMNLGGALYLKSLEFSLITENLRLPLSTILKLMIFNILIILSHKLYRNSRFSNNIKFSFNNFLEKLNLINFKKIPVLYMLSIIAILGKIFYFSPGISIGTQSVFAGPKLLQDLIIGIQIFIFLPVIIFFSDSLFNIKQNNKKYLIFALYILCILFVSIITNSRSIFFDVILSILIINFLLFLFEKVKINKNFYLKLILVFFLVVPLFSLLENVSKNYIAERSDYYEKTPSESLKSFINNIVNEDNLEIYEKSIIRSNLIFFKENYYKSTIFNRINFLLVHDNFNYAKTLLTNPQKENIKELQVNKIISIFPQPIINMFKKEFIKRDYSTISTASYIYGILDYSHGKLSMGSGLMTAYIILDKWIYLFLLFFFIPFFIFLDSFYNNKLMIFSPFILIFFYTTGSGILSFLTATEISVWFGLPFRNIPQALLLVLLFSYFYNLYKKR